MTINRWYIGGINHQKLGGSLIVLPTLFDLHQAGSGDILVGSSLCRSFDPGDDLAAKCQESTALWACQDLWSPGQGVIHFFCAKKSSRKTELSIFQLVSTSFLWSTFDSFPHFFPKKSPGLFGGRQVQLRSHLHAERLRHAGQPFRGEDCFNGCSGLAHRESIPNFFLNWSWPFSPPAKSHRIHVWYIC